ncbi:MAG: hypothetical protein ACLP8S_06480 [Solirubrobacteraceae bacterium]
MIPTDQLEDRLRNVLDQYAQQIHADPPPWTPPDEVPAGARERAGRPAQRPISLGTVVTGLAVICSIAIAVLAIGLLDHPQRPLSNAANPPREGENGPGDALLQRPTRKSMR